MNVQIDGKTLGLLFALRDILTSRLDGVQAQQKALPRYLSDGTEVKTLQHVQAALNCDEFVATMYVKAAEGNKPPKGVQAAGKRALELIKDGRHGGGFTATGRARAAQLAAGTALSEQTVRRMSSYFARHVNDKKPGWSDAGKETPGYVAWLAWGGDAGAAWSRAMVRKWDGEKKSLYATCTCGDTVEFDAMNGWQRLDGSLSHDDGTTHSDHLFAPDQKKLPKTQTCSESDCKEQATKRVLWAEGRAYQPACDKHVEAVKKRIVEKNGAYGEIDGVRDIKAIRRVRTAEGARHFGQPIGSVIVSDYPGYEMVRNGSIDVSLRAKEPDYTGVHVGDSKDDAQHEPNVIPRSSPTNENPVFKANPRDQKGKGKYGKHTQAELDTDFKKARRDMVRLSKKYQTNAFDDEVLGRQIEDLQRDIDTMRAQYKAQGWSLPALSGKAGAKTPKKPKGVLIAMSKQERADFDALPDGAKPMYYTARSNGSDHGNAIRLATEGAPKRAETMTLGKPLNRKKTAYNVNTNDTSGDAYTVRQDAAGHWYSTYDLDGQAIEVDPARYKDAEYALAALEEWHNAYYARANAGKTRPPIPNGTSITRLGNRKTSGGIDYYPVDMSRGSDEYYLNYDGVGWYSTVVDPKTGDETEVTGIYYADGEAALRALDAAHTESRRRKPKTAPKGSLTPAILARYERLDASGVKKGDLIATMTDDIGRAVQPKQTDLATGNLEYRKVRSVLSRRGGRIYFTDGTSVSKQGSFYRPIQKKTIASPKFADLFGMFAAETKAAAWDESLHPRKGGKFAPSNGGTQGDKEGTADSKKNGNRIAKTQAALVKAGFLSKDSGRNGGVDGLLGPKTAAALKAALEKAGLKGSDGSLNDDVMNTILQAVSGKDGIKADSPKTTSTGKDTQADASQKKPKPKKARRAGTHAPSGAPVRKKYEDGSILYTDGTVWDPEEQRYRPLRSVKDVSSGSVGGSGGLNIGGRPRLSKPRLYQRRKPLAKDRARRIANATAMKDIEAFLALYEEKMRHVRTPEGARRFGLPIGAAIPEGGGASFHDVGLQAASPSGPKLPKPRKDGDWTIYDIDILGHQFGITADDEGWYSYHAANEKDTDGEYYDTPQKALAGLVKFAATVKPKRAKVVKMKVGHKEWPAGTKLQDPPPPAKRPLGEKKPWRDATPAEIEKLVEWYGSSVRPNPGWTNVQVNPLVLTGEDDSAIFKGISQDGKWKTNYTPHHWARQNGSKFDRVATMIGERKKIETAVNKDAETNDAAGMLALMLFMGLRPDTSGGKNMSTRGYENAYGASTLERRHVVQSGSKMSLQFVSGKKGGSEITLPVTNPTVKKALAARMNRKPNERLFGVTEDAADEYLKRVMGSNYKMKDLRTMVGTASALKYIKDNQIEKPTTQARLKAIKKEVAEAVAAILGNTPTVALSSYIAPAVWDDMEKDL